jgi:hypothetical protein
MCIFDTYIEDLQRRWRESNGSTSEMGFENGTAHPWILPATRWEDGLWPPLRTGGSWPVQTYLDQHGVDRHSGSHNLKSSWISGVNLYFPFGRSVHGRSMLAAFLASHVDSRVRTVESVELEYAETGTLSPSELLGETGGSRGRSQTSPDMAFLVNGRAGLLLVENKLCEHSFYPCSARKTTGSDVRSANPDVSRCNRTTDLAANALPLCHQQVWGRKYWERLQDAVDRQRIASLKCCPAAKAGYQLFRQQALAEGIARSPRYDFVVSSVALDRRNDVLAGCLRTTGLGDVRQWGDLFMGEARFRVFSHQD